MKLKDLALYIGLTAGSIGIGAAASGCSGNNNEPRHELTETVMQDVYADVKSSNILADMVVDMNALSKYDEEVFDKSKRTEWDSYVDAGLEQIQRSNALAIRSLVEHQRYSSLENALDKDLTRLTDLFSRSNYAIDLILNRLDVDPYAQTVKKNEKIRLYDYDENKRLLKEYVITFKDGADLEDFGGSLSFTPRNVEVMKNEYRSLSEAPKEIYKDEKEIDFANDQFTFARLLDD